MRLFLTAKHWQIFIVLLIGVLLGNFTFVGHPEISVAVRVTGFLITFAWQLSIGHGLYQFLPAKVEVKYNLFIINWFVVTDPEAPALFSQRAILGILDNFCGGFWSCFTLIKFKRQR
jgi:hypothetical protein